MAERLKAAVLKTAMGAKPIGGSNPSPSAKLTPLRGADKGVFGEVAEWLKAAVC